MKFTILFLICIVKNFRLTLSTPFMWFKTVVIRIRRFPVQTLLGTWLGLGTQPRYKAPGDLLVKIVEKAVINIELVRLWEVGCGTAK